MNIERLRHTLQRHEGFRSKVYFDTEGIPTIGFGRNLRDAGISRLEALYLLDNDINKLIVALPKVLPWFTKLDEVRQEALINMAFNLGLGGLLGFKNMLATIATGDYTRAAKEVLASKYAKQVGRRAQEIAEMLRSGKYPSS